jgi:hypothetical protein
MWSNISTLFWKLSQSYIAILYLWRWGLKLMLTYEIKVHLITHK